MKGAFKMKYSIQFSDAIHILTYIEIFKDTNYLSSEMIASSVETNAANVRKIMSNLKKSHLILTQTGKAKPTLAKSPTEITLLDVYQSIEGNTNLIQVDPKTNPDCIVGANIQDVLTSTYTRLQASVEAEMSQISLQQIIEQIAESEKRPENAVFVKPYLS
ncbi:hypothetical protein RV04_GL000301 [Enterococcus hermanniensis]|uniref:Rrf2 family protein n=2 Tax=Enterococcus hermanniensis TaxID=249189 RepID=A0A1L8TSN8_9ENTE|nr:hypothetical protein RV04_GL000301 [Enterococcus hermanniensis]